MFDEHFVRLKIGICPGLTSNLFVKNILSKHFDIVACSSVGEMDFSSKTLETMDLDGFVYEQSIPAYLEYGDLLPTVDFASLDAEDHVRESFFTRMFRFNDWKALESRGLTAGELVNFQAEQKYLMMAYDPNRAKILGRLVAKSGDSGDIRSLADDYIKLTLDVLKTAPDRKRHTNALQHVMGYLSKDLDRHQKRELLDCIFLFQSGDRSITAPLDLLKRHFATYPNSYMSKQRYLRPFPADLRLHR